MITRRSNYLTRWGWNCEGYTSVQLGALIRQAGLTSVAVRQYPWRYGWLNVADILIEGRAPLDLST